MVKRIRLIVLFLCVAVLFVSCGKEPSLTTAISALDADQLDHLHHLPAYDSPYTIGYERNDGTYALYIFSSPIQYASGNGYAVIDNTVIASDTEFAYENAANSIKSYFPQTLSDQFVLANANETMKFSLQGDTGKFSKAKSTTYLSMYGDSVSAVAYKSSAMDMFFYPTQSGIKSEIVLKKKPAQNSISFFVTTSASSFENNRNGYILFKTGDEIDCMVNAPITKDSGTNSPNYTTECWMDVAPQEGGYLVSIEIPQMFLDDAQTVFPICLDPSFELRQEKTPDSTVYSQIDINNYLRPYAVIGKHPLLGEGWHFTRLKVNWLFSCPSDNVISASYHCPPLFPADTASPVSLFRAETQWFSSMVSWNNKPSPADKIAESSNGVYDVTSFVKTCLGDVTCETESIGFLSQLPGDGYEIIPTSENTLYAPYVVVILKQEPTFLGRP